MQRGEPPAPSLARGSSRRRSESFQIRDLPARATPATRLPVAVDSSEPKRASHTVARGRRLASKSSFVRCSRASPCRSPRCLASSASDRKSSSVARRPRIALSGVWPSSYAAGRIASRQSRHYGAMDNKSIATSSSSWIPVDVLCESRSRCISKSLVIDRRFALSLFDMAGRHFVGDPVTHPCQFHPFLSD